MTKDELKQEILDNIKPNARREITGQKLQDVLLDCVDTIFNETDPIFSQSPAAGITSADIDSWDAKASQADIADLRADVEANSDAIETNAVDIEGLKEIYRGLTQSDIVVVEAADWPVADPAEDTIYRVQGVSNYSDYVWNGSQFILMATYNNSIDLIPTAGSANLVESGGVYDKVTIADTEQHTQVAGSYTLAVGSAPSLDNPPASTSYKYVRITGVQNGMRLVTTNFRCTSARKQVGYVSGGIVTAVVNNTATTTSYDIVCDGTWDEIIFNNAVANVLTVTLYKPSWLKDVVEDLRDDLADVAFSTGERLADVGIDATPLAGSANLPTSGGVATAIASVSGVAEKVGFINASSVVMHTGSAGQNSHSLLKAVKAGDKVVISFSTSVLTSKYYCWYSDAAGQSPIGTRILNIQGDNIVTAPTGANYLIVCYDYDGNGTRSDIKLFDYTSVDASLQSQIDAIVTGSKSLKVLLIGSSHGVNTISMFPVLAENAGIDITCGNLYIGSATIGFFKTRPAVQIPYMAEHDVPFNTFKVWRSGAWSGESTKTIDYALDLYEWDVIILQRGASENTDWDEAISNFFQNLLDHIQARCSYTPRIYFNSGIANVASPATQRQQTIDIMNSAKSMQAEYGLSIIPTAVAVQYARATYLKNTGVYGDMASDTQHLDTGVGQYVTGCCVFETIVKDLLGMSVRELDYLPVYSDVSGNVVNSGSQFFTPITDYFSEIGKTVAALAVQDGDYVAATAAELAAKYASLPTAYSVTNSLSHCSSDNVAATIDSNEPYMAFLTPDAGYEITAVSVTMAGVDITNDVYVAGYNQSGIHYVYNTIRIGKVTGNIVITATATPE